MPNLGYRVLYALLIVKKISRDPSYSSSILKHILKVLHYVKTLDRFSAKEKSLLARFLC